MNTRRMLVGLGLALVVGLGALLFEPGRAKRPAQPVRPAKARVALRPAAVPSRLPVGGARRLPVPAALRAAPAAPPPAAARTVRPDDAIPNEYVLSFFDDRDRDAFARLARALGADVLGSSDFGHALRLRVRSAEQLARLLAEGPRPLQVGSNYRTRVPSPADLVQRQADGPYVGFGGAALAWLGVAENNAAWGRGLTVAVLDTGVQAHPAMGNAQISQLDLVGGDAGTGSAADHGTAVASLIAGRADGVLGVAPAADVLSVRVMNPDGTGDTFTLAQGIVAAVDAGARVLNLSLGSFGDDFLLADAVRYAQSQGAVLVAATGNGAVNVVQYPAAYEGVLAVTAVDGEGRHLYVANSGPEVSLAAPGVGVSAAGAEGGVTQFSGTSAATPFVSGALVAVMSQQAGLTAPEAAAILLANGNDAGAPGADPVYGQGILDLGRVQQRNTAGVYDIAVTPPYLDPASAGTQLLLSAQNRGTETLKAVDLLVAIDGLSTPVHFFDVPAGQTVTRTFDLDAQSVRRAEGVRVQVGAAVDGVTDVYPANNSPVRFTVGFAPPAATGTTP